MRFSSFFNKTIHHSFSARPTMCRKRCRSRLSNNIPTTDWVPAKSTKASACHSSTAQQPDSGYRSRQRGNVASPQDWYIAAPDRADRCCIQPALGSRPTSECSTGTKSSARSRMLDNLLRRWLAVVRAEPAREPEGTSGVTVPPGRRVRRARRELR